MKGIWIGLGITIVIIVILVIIYAGVCGFYLNSWYCAAKPAPTPSGWDAVKERYTSEVDDKTWLDRIFKEIGTVTPDNAPSVENFHTLTTDLANEICAVACPHAIDNLCNCQTKKAVNYSS